MNKFLSFFTKKKSEKEETTVEQNKLPYTHCLNCGTELQGHFCHVCGQGAVKKTPTVAAFIIEYINNAFIWDPKFFSTIWTLIRRPGHLTNEFLSGKFISQEHPLKLNMFLLFVFITLFVFFSSAEKMTDSVYSMTHDERVLSGIQIESLLGDEEYAKKMEESPRDTVLLLAPLALTKNYPQIVHSIAVQEDTKGEGLDKWVAVLPRVLIEDKILVRDEEGSYRFNEESKVGKSELDIVNSLSAEMVRIASKYFPILLLLTTPFLSISLRLVQRKSHLPRIHHYIFALHYTAFLEVLILGIYILHLTVAPSMNLLKWVLIVGSCLYLTIAFRRVYATKSWWRAIVKSLLTCLIYFFILLLIFIGIFIAACFIIAYSQLELGNI